MIVDPDFFDHWKTQMLVDLSKDDASPLWVLRIWSHAQQRRTGTFETLPPPAIKAITRAKSRHRAEQIADWLEAAGFIRRSGQQVVVHEWEEYNKGLFANWKNGTLGGRPPKPKHNGNPTETHGLAMGNPSQTQSKPIRVEEIQTDSAGATEIESFKPDDQWLALLQHNFPDRDVLGELSTFKAFCKKRGTAANRRGFEGWIKKASPSIKHNGTPPEPDPDHSRVIPKKPPRIIIPTEEDYAAARGH